MKQLTVEEVYANVCDRQCVNLENAFIQHNVKKASYFLTKIRFKFLFIFPSYIFGHIYILEIENAVLFYTWKQTFFNLHIKVFIQYEF